MIFVRSLILLVFLASAAGDARAQETVEGFEYVLDAVKPDAGSLGDAPEMFEDPTRRIVEQGPEFTLMWIADRERTLEAASFARGETRMGLFVPYRDLDRPSSDPDGWTSYGDPLEYDRFEVELVRGDDDRTVAGAPAAHYRLTADIVVREEGESAFSRSTLTSDVWIHEDAPFTSAPLSVDRAYADPRLQAILAAADEGALRTVISDG